MREERSGAGLWRGQRQKIKWDIFRPEDRPFARLLDALASWNVREEMVQVERHATARQEMADVLEQEQEVAEEQVEQARDELGVFRDALRSAYQARPQAASFDSANPVEDRSAGALINYLVRTEHAEVRTDDLGDQRYRYHVEVDWPRLEQLASGLDLDLASMLS